MGPTPAVLAATALAIAASATAASITEGAFEISGSCVSQSFAGSLSGDHNGSPFYLSGISNNEPIGLCGLFELAPGQTYLTVRDNYYPDNRLGQQNAIIPVESALIDGALYIDPVLRGSIVFSIPSITIPDITAAQVTLADIPIQYLIDLNGWLDWESYITSEPPLFHLSATGFGRIPSLSLYGWTDPSGLWAYYFESASFDLAGPAAAPLSDSPEPHPLSLLVVGLIALALGALRRRPRR